MSHAWSGSSRLRASATNNGDKPTDTLDTSNNVNDMVDDIVNDDDSVISAEYEQDEDGEDEDVMGSSIFKHSLRMPPYEHAKRKLSQLTELMNGPYLDLAPHYQRGVVWTRKAMRLLIDSMWKGYYIPPVIFNLELIELEDGNLRYKRTCVDGKQRLTSIRDFMNGEFPCSIDKKSWYFAAPPGKRRSKLSILPESARQEFREIEVLCTEYKGLTKSQEIELFQRVQLGKPLTRAEAFRATQGGWQDFAKSYEKEFTDVINLCKHSRASGFRTIMICFLQIYECVDPAAENGIPMFRGSIQAIETFCSNPATLDTNAKAHLRYVFETIRELVQMDRTVFENHNYTQRQVFSPIELVGAACLISQKGAERPKGMLLGDILALRSHLREVHPDDIRINRPCWQTVWKFIDTIETHRGACDGSTVLKKPPKIVKKKPQSHRSAQSISAGGTASQARSAKASRPVTAEKDDRHSNLSVNEQLSIAAGRMPEPSARREDGTILNSPKRPSTNNFASEITNDGDQAALSRRSRNQPALVPSRISSKGVREGAAAENRRLRLEEVTSNSDRSGNDRAASQGLTISGSGTPLTPSALSPTFGNAAGGYGSMNAPLSRKRAALDLGGGSGGTRELESKKARLMAGYVKQEKDV
ncbi:hypothetical protein MMC07_005839 [Pseudocyphellaria aurata]|nr:hypothetical protein [Pseudocyphellaria aurata]